MNDEQIIRIAAECVRIGVEVERESQAAIRLKLDRRIQNQRKALRQNWEVVEMRASYKHLPKEVRSRMLAGWCKAVNARDAYKRAYVRMTKLSIFLICALVVQTIFLLAR